MRYLPLLLIVLSITLLTACPEQTVDSEPSAQSENVPPPVAGGRQPVLVELFTSEGCSSCPPADKNLAFLERQQPVSGADIVTLEMHVDYWDRLGWKDPFSSAAFTNRQENYARALKLDSNYTPQMIVDGEIEFVGSDTVRAPKEIASALFIPKAKMTLQVDENRLHVKATDIPRHGDATILMAIAEDGLSSRVSAGENSGATLDHVSVVRELTQIGELNASTNEIDITVDLKAPAVSRPENLKVVVFFQENASKRVIGVMRSKFGSAGK